MAAPVTGRPAAAAAQASALQPDIVQAGTVPGWRSSSGAADVPYSRRRRSQPRSRTRCRWPTAARGSYLRCQPAAASRQTKSTSSPTGMSTANPAAAAARRTTSAAPGTYGTRAPGRTMLSVGPMSSADLASSYRASQPRPGSWATIRGATAPTAGSAKCGSSCVSQPVRGTQSESMNATSGVRTAARPAFRAAPVPPLRSRRRQSAPAAAAAAATAA